MKALNIRDFPPELLLLLKTKAAQEGITLREVVIETLGTVPLRNDQESVQRFSEVALRAEGSIREAHQAQEAEVMPDETATQARGRLHAVAGDAAEPAERATSGSPSHHPRCPCAICRPPDD